MGSSDTAQEIDSDDEGEVFGSNPLDRGIHQESINNDENINGTAHSN